MRTITRIIMPPAICIALGLTGPVLLFGHGEKKKPESPRESSATLPAGGMSCEATVTGGEFPNLHPLVAHFPIVLLLLAPFAQLAGMAHNNASLRTSAFLLAGGGTLAAFVAARILHPHTGPLDAEIRLILERHEFFADCSLLLGIVSVALSATDWIPHSRKTVIGGVTFLVMLAAAVTVSLAGHKGAELVHIHGVGPCGQWLEPDKATDLEPGETR